MKRFKKLSSKLSLSIVAFAICLPVAGHAQPEWAGLGGRSKVTDLIAAGDFGQALLLAKSQLAEAEAARGSSHPDLLPILHDLGTIYLVRQNVQMAEQTFRRSLDIAKQAFGGTDSRTKDAMKDLATALLMDQRFQEAQQLLQQADVGR
ncbi:tetratricopeptide repeat protein [Rhodopseudomonas sp. G2_2311]|uniref:tetratricopeptide repeat protein n=1 Tax=Rhodopseudomonas sp. G2_2311 TaxID=3114287 RepID=UPI0039C6C706